MNEALVILMMVTSTGIQNGPTFKSLKECEAISTKITTAETFCYYQRPVDINAAIEQMGDIMNRMRQQLQRTKEEKPTL